jgi:hypothetical protein
MHTTTGVSKFNHRKGQNMSKKTEKVWVDGTALTYPGKFILVTDIEFIREGDSGRYFGLVQGVYETWDEAVEIERTLNQPRNQTEIVEGFVEDYKIGGVEFVVREN